MWPFNARMGKYSLIADDKQSLDVGEDGIPSPPHNLPAWTQQPHHPRRPTLSALVIIALSLALSVLLTLHLSLLHSLSPPIPLSCGSTISSALSKNCTFDPIAKHWLPAQCPRYGETQYLSAALEIENSSSWKYYSDRNLTQEISLEDISEMAGLGENAEANIWWSTNAEHAVHCAWALTRTAHAWHFGERIDRVGEEWAHTEHCVGFLLGLALKSPGVGTMAAFGNAAFGWC